MSILFLPMTKLFHSVRTAFVILEKMLVGKWFLSEHIPCPPVLVLGPQETPPPGGGAATVTPIPRFTDAMG